MNHEVICVKHGLLSDTYSFNFFIKGQNIDMPQSNYQPSYADFSYLPSQHSMTQYRTAKKDDEKYH